MPRITDKKLFGGGYITMITPEISKKRSLQTHCPMMLRAHTEGNTFNEDVCRCDVTFLKEKVHPNRCSSTRCVPREIFTETVITANMVYELIPKK